MERGITNLHAFTKPPRITCYPGLFKAAFGAEKVISVRIAFALAQFLKSIVSYTAVMIKVDFFFRDFTQGQKNGKVLHFSRCAVCRSVNKSTFREKLNNPFCFFQESFRPNFKCGCLMRQLIFYQQFNFGYNFRVLFSKIGKYG